MGIPIETWRATRSGAVRRLVGAEVASLAGDFMVLAAMPFAVLALGGSAAAIGAVLAAQGLGVAATLPVGGVLGDRWDRRRLMIAADLVRLTSQGLIAFLLITGSATLWELVVAQLVHGFATGLFMPAATAIVPDVVDHADVQATNGLKAIARAVAASIGPLLGAVAVAGTGPGSAMAVDAGTFGVSALLTVGLGRWHRRRPAPDRAGPSVGRDFQDGWREFWDRDWLRAVTIEFTLVNALVIAPFYVLAPVVAEEAFDGAASWAMILAFLAGGQFLGGAAAMSWHPGRPLVAATVVFLGWTAALTTLALQLPLWMVLCGAFVAGGAQAGFGVLWDTTVQTQVPSGSRSRLASVEMFGSLVFVPFGFLTGGWLERNIGATATLLLGVGTLLVASAAVLMTPGVRRLRAAGPVEPDAERALGRRVTAKADNFTPRQAA